MSTEYFARVNPCPHCGRAENEVNIGMKACGWRFVFRRHIEPRILRIDEWRAFLAANPDIVDEYSKTITVDQFWAMVESAQDQKSSTGEYDGFREIDGYDFFI